MTSASLRHSTPSVMRLWSSTVKRRFAFASTDSAFASDQNVLVVMAFAGHIVVVAVDGLQLGNQRAHLTRITYRIEDLVHHQVAVRARKVLRPFDGLDVIVKMLGAFRKIGEILVRQVAEELLHVLASQLDEVAAHAIADAPRTAVQHEPDHVRFIETNLDEVVAGSQGAQMIRVVSAIELRMLFKDGIVARLQALPSFGVWRGDGLP